MKRVVALAVALLAAQAACDSLAPQLVDNVHLHWDTEDPMPTKTMPSSMTSVEMDTTGAMTSAEMEMTAEAKAAMVSELNCAELKPMLVVVFGLMRNFRDSWPSVKKSLQLSAWEKCGTYDVVVATDLNSRCSEKDLERNRDCKKDQNTASDAFEQEIKNVYGPSVKIINNDHMRNLDRISDALGKVNGINDFAYQVFLRADASFSWPKINVVEVCKDYLGGNIISGDYTRPCHGSNRDWDFAFLGCGQGAMTAMFLDKRTCNDWPSCKTQEKQPPTLRDVTHDNSELAKGCDGAWGCEHSMCGWTARLQLAKFPPLATLDKIGLFASIPQPGAQSALDLFTDAPPTPSMATGAQMYPQGANQAMGHALMMGRMIGLPPPYVAVPQYMYMWPMNRIPFVPHIDTGLGMLAPV